MEEEQKKRYTEDKKSKKGRTGTHGSFNHVQTIYTGSDPRTTPTTLDSTCPSSSSHRPDSGFRSRTHTPQEPSSGERSVDSHRQSGGRKDGPRNDQASNFDDPHVMGQQERRKQYSVINSVTKSKRKPSKMEEEGEEEINDDRLLALPEQSHRMWDPIDSEVEEEGTIGGSRMFVGSGRAMVQNRGPFIARLSVVPEDDCQYSDAEKDGTKTSLLPSAADHENVHRSGSRSLVKEHRSLTQVMGVSRF